MTVAYCLFNIQNKIPFFKGMKIFFSMKKVGIIGGSGFIGSDIVSLFLNNFFDVKVSTIDITKKENYEHLMELDHADNLYVCELDQENEFEMTIFIKDCDFVLFTDQPNLKF